ncbi:dsRBD fold-containing protein [Mycobacterium sp. 050134]|uniref:dsRBD fold-containing protein n=1 Tax=Mycobacterium sp. 050134 TaxID=3096111 RepID=UPI002ED86021
MTLPRSMIRETYRMHRNIRPADTLHPMVSLAIDERGGRTCVKAELRLGGAHLAGVGVAYRHPSDCLTRETGQELATARALSDLAEQVSALRRVRA